MKIKPKRTGFVSVQNSQTMNADGYGLLPVRTGYERVVGSRTTQVFCVNAKDDGKVTDVSNGVVSVEYNDGTTGVYDIGDKYAPWSGKTVKHHIVTTLQKGDMFAKGQVITYNENFFKPDKLIPGQVSLVSQVLARTALIEGGDVYEDSCAISSEFSKKLSTTVAEVRSIVVEEGQDIRDLVSVGDVVESDSILCTIVNTQTDSSFYDDDTLSMLSKLASITPRAKYKGTVTKIEAVYTGEVETMPSNLQEVVLTSDKQIFKYSRKKGKPISGGRVDIGYQVNKIKLGRNMTAIKVYISVGMTMEAGDKLVVSSQLKGTVGRVWTDNNTDEDGIPIDAYFSGQSVDNRIVDSPILIGSTSTLMLAITDKVLAFYFDK